MFMVDITIVTIVFMGVFTTNIHITGAPSCMVYGQAISILDGWHLQQTSHDFDPICRASVDMALCAQSVLKQHIQFGNAYIYIYIFKIVVHRFSAKKTKIYIRVVSWVWCRIHVSACNYAIYAWNYDFIWVSLYLWLCTYTYDYQFIV